MNKFLILLSLLVSGYILVGVLFPIDEEIRDSRVISNCWDEELKICKDENKGDACTFGVYKLCAAKHPKMQKTFESRLDTCTYKNDGNTIDNPDIAVGYIVGIDLPTTTGLNWLQVWITYQTDAS